MQDTSDTKLLKAAIAPKEEALSFWSAWRREVEFETISYTQMRFIPLIYQRLLEWNVQDPYLHKYKGIYLYHLVRNQRLYHQVQFLLQELRQRGIELLLLKGAALELFYYPRVGTRPMQDFDLLVRKEQLKETLNTFEELGWQPSHRSASFADFNAESVFEIHHALCFKKENTFFVDLHLHLFSQFATYDAELFWHAAETCSFFNIPLKRLCPTDLFFHLTLHGMESQEATGCGIYWMLDVTLLLKRTLPLLNWQRLTYLCAIFRWRQFFLKALFQLEEHCAIAWPQEELASFKRSLLSSPCLETQLLILSHRASLLEYATMLWHWHKNLQAALPFLSQILSFPRFLKRFWQVSSLWQVFKYSVGKGIKRLKRVKAAGH